MILIEFIKPVLKNIVVINRKMIKQNEEKTIAKQLLKRKFPLCLHVMHLP